MFPHLSSGSSALLIEKRATKTSILLLIIHFFRYFHLLDVEGKIFGIVSTPRLFARRRGMANFLKRCHIMLILERDV